MLLRYRRRAEISALVFLVTAIVDLLLSGLVGSDFWTRDKLLYVPIPIAMLGSFWYGFWCFAKAKGYSGLVGVMLPFLSVVGLVILLALKDKHKDSPGSSYAKET